MRAYRIVKKRHVLTAFSGEGARTYGGRWNLPGVPMVYTAQSRALAALESLGHFGGAERRLQFVTFEIEFPDAVAMKIEVADLPPDWRRAEPVAATQALGSEWQGSGRSVALLVPSVHVPQELCVLLNPDHPDARRVMVAYPEPFTFDGRLNPPS